MTDMKKLMGDAYLDAKTAQSMGLEKLAEAALVPSVDLDPIFDISALTNLRRVRTDPGHVCVAYVCDQGILLRERHGKLQYLLTWGAVRDMMPTEE